MSSPCKKLRTILWKVGLPQPKSSSESPLCMAKVLIPRSTSSCTRYRSSHEDSERHHMGKGCGGAALAEDSTCT